ncbi:phosphotransferase enzyme family protein [Bacillus horti]|nr:phosphotransferase [Bacillus horti]
MELLDSKKIASKWGVEVNSIKELSERVTLITTKNGQDFILKKKGSIEHFKRELKLLNHLKQEGLPIQYPLQDNNKDYIVAFQGDNYCLYSFLEGTTYSSQDSLQNSIIPQLYGQAIATLNKAMENVNFEGEFESKDLYQMVYGFAIDRILKTDGRSQLGDIYQDLEGEFKKAVQVLPKQLIHRDPHIHNFIWNKDKLEGVIDFDLVEVNVRIFDLCYCSTSVLSEVFSNEDLRNGWIHFVGNLVCQYHRYNRLTDEELESIWLVMLGIQTVFMAYFSNYKDIFEVNKAMFLWIFENKLRLENEWQSGRNSCESS